MLVTIVQCTLCIRTTFAFELVLISFFFVSCLPSNSLCLRKAFAFAFEETLLCLRRAFAFPIEGVLPFKDHCQCLRRAISFAFEGPLPSKYPCLYHRRAFRNSTYNASNYSIALTVATSPVLDSLVMQHPPTKPYQD